jgi:alpha-N-arabinofuranosidase
MDEYDPERRIKLIYDEWGAWHPVEKGKPAGGLYQQNTIRDACVAAITLDTFHNNADKLYMANIAQLINVLQAVLLVNEDSVVKTPTYHVFDLYRPHKGAQAVRLVNSAETVSDGGASAEHCRRCYRDKQPFALRAVQGSASIKNDAVCVTVVNTHPSQAVDLDLEIHKAHLETAEVVALSTGDIHDHNTFGEPNLVKLACPQTLRGTGCRVRVQLAPASVSRVIGKLY